METTEIPQVIVYLAKGALLPFLSALRSAPDEIRPTSFSLGENERRTDISEDSELEQLCSEYPQGFFLHASACRYDVMGERLASGFEVVVAEPKKGFDAEDGCETILELAASTGMAFSLAACRAEYLHRNRFYMVRFGGDCETWAGRDLNKHLPGLYWLTAVSQSLLSDRSISLEPLSQWIVRELPGVGGDSCTLLRFYEKPNDWQSNAKELDELCESIGGIFSLRQAKRALRRRWTLNGALDLLTSEYR